MKNANVLMIDFGLVLELPQMFRLDGLGFKFDGYIFPRNAQIMPEVIDSKRWSSG